MFHQMTAIKPIRRQTNLTTTGTTNRRVSNRERLVNHAFIYGETRSDIRSAEIEYHSFLPPRSSTMKQPAQRIETSQRARVRNSEKWSPLVKTGEPNKAPARPRASIGRHRVKNNLKVPTAYTRFTGQDTTTPPPANSPPETRWSMWTG